MDDWSMLYGLKVVVQHDSPKMQLSADCPVTDDFRKEMDAWMRDFFGTTNLLRDGEVWQLHNKTLHMNPRTFAQFKAAAPSKEKQ